MSNENQLLVPDPSSQPLQPDAENSCQKTPITIGDEHYDIDISEIPYLSSFASFQVKAQPRGSNLVHGPIPLFNVAIKSIESGYRQCFRTLPPDLSQYHIICETYEYLGIDVLGKQHIDELFQDLRACKEDYELEYKRYQRIKGNKSKARDTAFKVLYLILLGHFEDEHKEAGKMFNVVLFIVSHSGTFKWRTRKIIRAAYEERFVVSQKQLARLDQWVKEDDAGDFESDVTTEEEPSDHYYDSDDW